MEALEGNMQGAGAREGQRLPPPLWPEQKAPCPGSLIWELAWSWGMQLLCSNHRVSGTPDSYRYPQYLKRLGGRLYCQSVTCKTQDVAVVALALPFLMERGEPHWESTQQGYLEVPSAGVYI